MCRHKYVFADFIRDPSYFFAEFVSQSWMEKCFGLIDSDYAWITGPEFKQDPCKSSTVAHRINIARFAHPIDRLIFNATLRWWRGITIA